MTMENREVSKAGDGAIRLLTVSKYFADQAAVKDLSLEIENREHMVLLGPSGCGKTTTLNMLAGLEIPTSGQILFGDKDVTRMPPEERDISMVFQTIGLYPPWRALASLPPRRLPLCYRGMSSHLLSS